jgi:hypothetical protein
MGLDALLSWKSVAMSEGGGRHLGLRQTAGKQQFGGALGTHAQQPRVGAVDLQAQQELRQGRVVLEAFCVDRGHVHEGLEGLAAHLGLLDLVARHLAGEAGELRLGRHRHGEEAGMFELEHVLIGARAAPLPVIAPAGLAVGTRWGLAVDDVEMVPGTHD